MVTGLTSVDRRITLIFNSHTQHETHGVEKSDFLIFFIKVIKMTDIRKGVRGLKKCISADYLYTCTCKVSLAYNKLCFEGS